MLTLEQAQQLVTSVLTAGKKKAPPIEAVKALQDQQGNLKAVVMTTNNEQTTLSLR